MSLRAALTTALISLALPVHAPAQEISLMGGRAEYDLSGTHTSNVWAVRGAIAPGSFLLVEGSVSYIHTRQDFFRSQLWLPEVQLQAQARWGAVAPYLGVGIGAAIDDRGEDELDGVDLETQVDFMTSVAAGVRVALFDRIGLRVDGRLHGVEIDYAGSVAGVTAGVTIGL